jgi:hypothetical protein
MRSPLKFWSLFFAFQLLLGGVAIAMQPLPMTPEKSITMVKVGEMHDGEVTVWKLTDPKTQVVCYITIGELHGWTLSQTCLPTARNGRAR